MDINRGCIISVPDDRTCHSSMLIDRPPSRLSRVSSTSSKINREEMTLMNDTELDDLCAQVFALCDTNGDGYITEDELMAQCGEDDPELLDHLMKTMDTNEDGKISFDEFRSGLEAVSRHLNLCQSTPTAASNRPDDQAIFEHNPSLINDNEEVWLSTMSRIDPAGYISNNNELRSVWLDLLPRNGQLLDKFEAFLSNIVEELHQSHSDVQQIEKRMQQLLTDHSKEVSEMDDVLNEQLREACIQEQAKSEMNTTKISDQYKDLLAERDKLITSLAEQEQTLQHRLVERIQSEQEMRRERLQLLNLNRSLQDQLSDSYRQLSASQREIQRLSFHDKFSNEGNNPGFYPLLDEPETSSLSVSESHDNQSVASQCHNDDITLSPPPDPPIELFQSPNLAFEVAQALEQERNTPTSYRSASVTPTEDESSKLLPSNDSLSDQDPETQTSNPETSVPLSSNPHNPSVSPVYDTPNPFIPSTQLHQRRDLRTTHPPSLTDTFTAPSRVFKVVFLGDSGVGKTSLIHRLCHGSFNNLQQSTLGLDYSTCIVPVGDETVVFQLWDTAGQEKFQSTTAVYFKRADAFVVVYDVTNTHTFKNIKTWITLTKTTLRCDLPVVMVMGNKTDKEHQRNVGKEEGRQLALELCTMFSETSALSGYNVVQSHTMLASLLLERENQDIKQIKESAIRFSKLDEKKKCRC